MEQRILFWIFVVIFSATAAITLLGITNVLKINAEFLKTLFTAVILEVVAAIIVVFQSFDFNSPPAVDLHQIIAEANISKKLEPRQSPESFIISQLKASDQIPVLSSKIDIASSELDSLMEILKNCQGNSEKIQSNLDELERTYYIKIKRLRDLINKYGGVINIAFQEEEKTPVYQLLIEIFSELGMVSNQTPIYTDTNTKTINFQTIKNMYRKYKKDNGQEIEDTNYIYITEFDTVLMIRSYLTIIAPVK